ncbi:MAG: type II toxin-antitoxin system mRNA interferase toxin, RelE/StbE family, partial [Patescibacteria group bacterium]|nr:type II toxin-antitoxin system mRNA interferase toxin, RelE/StbE family [Patescibacteria group bacterium]
LRSSNFKKQFCILSKKIQQKTFERLEIFKGDRFYPLLNNHSLHGEYQGCRSINITGDLRVIYKDINDSTCILLEIGTHGQLYE